MEVKPIEDILKITADQLPLMCFSDNPSSFFSYGIKKHQEGFYNHFFWIIQPGQFVSQDWMYHSVPMEKYMGNRLEMWHNPGWFDCERQLLKNLILKSLKEPWYRRMYDWPQIFGIMFGARWFQTPWRRICSDRVDILKAVDFDWKTGRHLSPPEIRRIFKADDKYQVFGRFDPGV